MLLQAALVVNICDMIKKYIYAKRKIIEEMVTGEKYNDCSINCILLD